MKIEEIRANVEAKTVEVRGFLAENKAEEAKTAMEELRGMKDSLAIAEELELEEKRDLESQKNDEERGNVKVGKVNEMRSVVKHLLGKEMTAEERAVVKISDNQAIVPKQFIAELEELRKGFGALKEICHVIPVTSNAGTKPCIDLDQGDKLPIVLEGADIEDDSLATTEIDFKVDKIGKLIRLSSESVDDAAVDIENLAKTVFLEKAVRAENARILNIIDTNAEALVATLGKEHSEFAKAMDSTVPAVKSGLITLLNSTLYAEWKNAEDKQGRNLNLITSIGDVEYFNGKPVMVFDDSLITVDETKNVGYMLNAKEAIKFFDRKEITLAKAEKFENDTKMLRILERIDVKKGSARSIKKITF